MSSAGPSASIQANGGAKTNGMQNGMSATNGQGRQGSDGSSDDVPLRTNSLFASSSSQDAGEEEEDQLEEDDDEPVASTSAAPAAAFPASSAAPAQPAASTSAATGIPGDPASYPLPHYTVEKSSPNSERNPHKIIVHPGVTDASRLTWPEAARWVPGSKLNGQVNWYEDEPADEGKHLSWRKGLGKGLATELELNQAKAGGKAEFWILKDWPENYKFSVHHTAKPGAAKDRLDAYLWGGRAKFRTVNEFLPHLVWLLTNGPGSRKRCACKYCTKSTQSDVNRAVGLVSHTGKRSSTPLSSSPAKSTDKPTPKTDKSDKKAAAPRKSLLSNVQTNEDDIEQPDTPSQQKKDSKGKRRLVETDDESTVRPRPAIVPLSQARIPKPVKSDTARGTPEAVPPPAKKRAVSPSYNGAYVHVDRDKDFKSGARHREGELVWHELKKPYLDDEGIVLISHWPAVVMRRSIGIDTKRIGTQADGKTPIFRNNEYPVYTVRLLAVHKELAVEEKELVAYLGKQSLTDEYFQGTIEDDRVRSQLHRVFDGRNVLRPDFESLETWIDAVVPLALAMQIVCRIVEYFCTLDVYRPKPSFAMITQALSVEQKEQLDREIQSTFFQRIKWGPETIWTGELVRILCHAATALKLAKHHVRGWRERSMFVRISAIWRDEGTADRPDCLRFSGRVYELESQFEQFDPSLGTITGKKVDAGTTIRDDDVRFPAMPRPPPGYRWFKLRTSSDAVFIAEHIAGRYYELPDHLRADTSKTDALRKAVLAKTGQPTISLSIDERAVVLAGLVEANMLYSRPQKWTEGILDSISNAEQQAQDDMKKYFEEWHEGQS